MGESTRVLPRKYVAAFLTAFLCLNGAGWLLAGRGLVRANEPSAAEGAVPVRVAWILPSEDRDAADRLSVVFTQPVLEGFDADGETKLPQVEAAPFRIEPPVPGTWEWTTPDRLSFLPDAPLGPCRKLVLAPTAELERIAGRPVAPDMEVTFETGPLQVQKVRVASSNNLEIVLEVRFNAAVEATCLEESLSFHPRVGRRLRSRQPIALQPSALEPAASHEAPIPFEVQTRGPERTHRIALARPSTHSLLVTVAADLRPAEGELGMAEAFHSVYGLPDRFTVVGTDARIFREQVGGTLSVLFNEALAPGQESLPVTVAPVPDRLTSRINGRRLVLEGAFEPRTEYRVQVGESVLAASGASLSQSVSLAVKTPRRSPLLRIPHSEGVLSPSGNLTLGLRAGGIDAVRVTAHQVLPGNVVAHARGNPKRHTSQEVRSRVYPLPPAEAAGTPVTLYTLDLAELFQDTPGGARGIYDLVVEDTASRWNSESATLRITDIGATAKEDADGVHVWSRSIQTAEPIAGARVSVMTVTDQALGSAQSDSSGYAFIPTPAAGAPGAPYLVLVETKSEEAADLAYLGLDGQRWSVPRDVARGLTVPGAADVFIYPERNLYRPGDTVHLTGIARSPKGLVHQSPVHVMIERPDGAVALEETVQPSAAQGHFHLDFPTSQDARTGIWSLRAEDPATGEIVGRANFSLEAFLPARFEVSAAAAASEDRATGSTRVDARSLAGTSVDGFQAHCRVRWTPIAPSPAAFPLFTFKPAKDERSPTSASEESILDEDGSRELPLPGAARLEPGLWKGRAEWTVTEPGSRSSVAAAAVVLDTSDGHFGLRVDRSPGLSLGARASGDAGSNAVAAAAPFHAVAVALDRTLTPNGSGRVWLRLDRVDQGYELEQSVGRMRWVRTETVHPTWNGPVSLVNGTAAAELQCPSAGWYRLTLQGGDEDSRAPVAVRFYATDGDPTRFEPPQGDAELVTLSAEDAPVRPGETMTVNLRSAVDGTALVTLEDSRVRWHGQVPVVNGKAQLGIPVPADLRGGAIVTAQVIRPLDATQSSWSPHRAYGILRVPTSHPESLVAVEITAPERVRPGERVTVSVNAPADPRGATGGRAAICHLWAVDEGIRLAGGHRPPSPRAHFFGPRAYTGRTTDAWFDLVPDLRLAGIALHIGGDSGLPGAARRRAPERVHRVPGVIWLEAVELDANGRATFDVDTPEFTGELTWMATVVDGDRYGNARAKTRLAGEVPMLVSSPRFVAPGDRFEIGLRFENQAEEPVTVSPTLALEGPFEERWQGAAPVEAGFGGASAPIAFRLDPGERAEHIFRLRATGTGRIAGTVSLGGAFASGRPALESAKLDLPVRSGQPLVRASGTRIVQAEHPGAVTIDPAALLGLDATDTLTDGTLSISSDFGIGLFAAGRYLTEYPFGCAEQTASRVWAILAMPSLASKDDDPAAALEETRRRVDAGFERLAMMQTSSGGIAYWPGRYSASAWASAYAAELMHAAAGLGFDVPASLQDPLCEYLELQLASLPSSAVLQQSVYVHALVALGRPQPGWTRRLAEQAERIGPGGRALVAGAFALEGEGARAKTLILDSRAMPSDQEGDQSRFRRLTSPTRTAALNLRTLLRIEPTSALVPGLAEALEAGRQERSGRWGNTIDNAAALVALAQFHRTFREADPDWSAGVAWDGNEAETIRSGASWSAPLTDPTGAVEIDAAGTGPLFVSVSMEGRAKTGEPARDAGLVIRRRWLDGAGIEVEPSSVQTGDLVFVEVTLRAQRGTKVLDVAVVDPLPGGFEVENPRLSAAHFEEGSEQLLGSPDRTEFLDDRVLIFDTAYDKPRVYRYALRAVAPGTFEHGPVQAEAMYEPEVSSVGSAAGLVTVLR